MERDKVHACREALLEDLESRHWRYVPNGPDGLWFSNFSLLVLFLLYFGGGIVYNHVNGARGEELIPHLWFWKNLPSYIVVRVASFFIQTELFRWKTHHYSWPPLSRNQKLNFLQTPQDGCIFVVRVITCQARENYSQNPDYGSTSQAGVSPSGRTYETL